jgi:hypothetical protein
MWIGDCFQWVSPELRRPIKNSRIVSKNFSQSLSYISVSPIPWHHFQANLIWWDNPFNWRQQQADPPNCDACCIYRYVLFLFSKNLLKSSAPFRLRYNVHCTYPRIDMFYAKYKFTICEIYKSVCFEELWTLILHKLLSLADFSYFLKWTIDSVFLPSIEGKQIPTYLPYFCCT